MEEKGNSFIHIFPSKKNNTKITGFNLTLFPKYWTLKLKNYNNDTIMSQFLIYAHSSGLWHIILGIQYLLQHDYKVKKNKNVYISAQKVGFFWGKWRILV